jgi:hypothetical protein
MRIAALSGWTSEQKHVGVVAIAIVILTAFGTEARGVIFGTAVVSPVRSSG